MSYFNIFFKRNHLKKKYEFLKLNEENSDITIKIYDKDGIKKNNIEVVGIVSGVCTIDSYDYFNNNLKYGVSSGYLLGEDVIDQICERDFYFGIAQSGISIRKNNEMGGKYNVRKQRNFENK